MKNLNYLNKYRVDLFKDGNLGDEYNGAFIIPREKNRFVVVASNGLDWEHVSLSLMNNSGEPLNRAPKWSEMCELKELFFESDETVIQIHPSDDEYIDQHPYTLHLWRPMTKEIPTPPSILVGTKKKVKK